MKDEAECWTERNVQLGFSKIVSLFTVLAVGQGAAVACCLLEAFNKRGDRRKTMKPYNIAVASEDDQTALNNLTTRLHSGISQAMDDLDEGERQELTKSLNDAMERARNSLKG